MLAFVCVSVFNLASDTIEKLVFVCLSVCVFVRICVAVEVLGVSTRVGHRTCTRASLHVRHTRSLRGR